MYYRAIAARAFILLLVCIMIASSLSYLTAISSAEKKGSRLRAFAEKPLSVLSGSTSQKTTSSASVSANSPPVKFRFVIHGGAGVISESIDSKPFYNSLSRIVSETYKYASNGGSSITALDVVEFAVRLLEDDPLFNAGRGAVYTTDQTHEMEASIMDGSNLKVIY
jgi:Asparaginase